MKMSILKMARWVIVYSATFSSILTWYLNDGEQESHHKLARKIKMSKDSVYALQNALV